MTTLNFRFAGSLISLLAMGCGTPPVGDAGSDSGSDTGVVIPVDGSSLDVRTFDVPPSIATDVVSDSGPMTNADASRDVAPLPPAEARVIALSAMGPDRLLGVAFAPNGSFYATGYITEDTAATADFRVLLAKFTAAGALDLTFGMNGFVSHNVAVGTNGEVARGIVVQPSGKIVISSTVEHLGGPDARDRDIALVRFNTNGTLDNTFGTNGVVRLDLSDGAVNGTAYVADSVWGLAQYPDGRIVLTGTQRRMGALDSDWVAVRLSVDGVRDATFGTNGLFSLDLDNRDASARNATILGDGSVVVAGYYTDPMSVVRPVLFKLTDRGVLDVRFATMGVYNPVILALSTESYAAALQGTNLVSIGYGRASAMENVDWLSFRVNSVGVRDMTFGNNGLVRIDRAGFSDAARGLLVLNDQRILLIGGGRDSDANSDGMIAMLTRDGALDMTFGVGGKRIFDLGGASDFFWAAALSPNGALAAIVGTRQVAAGMGNDDSVILLQPVQ